MRTAEQEQRGIEEHQQQQDQDLSSSSSSSLLCRSPLPTASTPLQQQPEWLQLNSGGKQQQRPRYHHQSPTLCRSPLPPTLMIPVMNVGPSDTPTTPTTSCGGGGNPLMIAAVQPTHSFTEVSKSNTTATTDLVNSGKFHSDNTTTTTTTDINNNINEDTV